jgi:hypothetical protein
LKIGTCFSNFDGISMGFRWELCSKLRGLWVSMKQKHHVRCFDGMEDVVKQHDIGSLLASFCNPGQGVRTFLSHVFIFVSCGIAQHSNPKLSKQVSICTHMPTHVNTCQHMSTYEPRNKKQQQNMFGKTCCFLSVKWLKSCILTAYQEKSERLDG